MRIELGRLSRQVGLDPVCFAMNYFSGLAPKEHISIKGSPPIDSKISCDITIGRDNELFLIEKFIVG
jgi:hypothetical protein